MTGFDSKRRMAQDKLNDEADTLTIVYTTPPAAQPEQQAEPVVPNCVAIIEVFDKDWRMEYLSLPVGKHKLYVQQYTYSTPQQQAEPVAYFDFQELKFSWAKHMQIGPVPVSIKVQPMKLYLEAPQQQAAPPQRQWVGLTDEEMSDTVADMDVDFGDLLWKVVCLTKIIEAKLKERNG